MRILYNVPRAVPLKTRRPRSVCRTGSQTTTRGVYRSCGENESAPHRSVVEALLTTDRLGRCGCFISIFIHGQRKIELTVDLWDKEGRMWKNYKENKYVS